MRNETWSQMLTRSLEGIVNLGNELDESGITAAQRQMIISLARQIYRLAKLLSECKRLEDIRLFEDWDDDEKVRP